MNEHKVTVRGCDVGLAWPVSAGWPLTLPTWKVLRAPAVHGVSSNIRVIKTIGLLSRKKRYPRSRPPPPEGVGGLDKRLSQIS